MSFNTRVIARLDVKGEHLIKGIHFEGVRKVGNPHDFALDYYKQGIDEILYIDAVASLYGRNNLKDIVSKTAKDIFIPITVGGGVQSKEDVKELLLAGADKVAINTAACKRPELISEVAEKFGSQCVVASIQAKKKSEGAWEAYIETGREQTSIDAISWAKELEDLGAGEILITSVDHEGEKKGFDSELVKKITEITTIPVIACGGMGNINHAIDVVKNNNASAIAMASVLHFKSLSVSEIKKEMAENGVTVRN